jgi:hypothetical protein
MEVSRRRIQTMHIVMRKLIASSGLVLALSVVGMRGQTPSEGSKNDSANPPDNSLLPRLERHSERPPKPESEDPQSSNGKRTNVVSKPGHSESTEPSRGTNGIPAHTNKFGVGTNEFGAITNRTGSTRQTPDTEPTIRVTKG